MGCCPWLDYQKETPAERRARSAQRRDELAQQRRLFDAWYRRYRSFGLGDQRAREHAGKRAARGKLPD